MNSSTYRFTRSTALTLALAAGWCSLAAAQPPSGPGQGGGGGGSGGFRIPNLVGPGGGMGGGGPMGPERKLLKKFDADNNGQLNIEEREAARAFIKKERESREAGGESRRPGPGGGGPMGGPGGMGGEEEKAGPGPMVSPSDVQPIVGDLYDPSVLRTIFLDFDHSDWETELEDFNNTDVEVPATMTVDGKKYPGVGVHFRGQSSYFGVRTGHKRSLNVSVDFTNEDLALATPSADGKKGEGTYKTLNLLNSHEDPSFMSSVLYSAIANHYIPAPRANFVRVVINGESWGVYVNIEQFNKDFVKRNFKAKEVSGTASREAGKGGREARWKVKGNPGARSGLEYTGDDVAAYKQKYQIKSSDNEGDWADLIHLCKVLNTTPPDELVVALEPILDIDATLKFLALDVVLANGDGYWTRSSDYSIYKDRAGKFHIIPHDMNEAFKASLMMPGGGGGSRRPGGPGGAGGPGGPNGGGPNGVGPEMRRPEGDAPPMEGRPGPDGPPADVIVPRDGQGQPAPDQPRRARGGQGGGGGGPGGRGGQSGTELDPLVGLSDPAKPLRSKLLAVPALRERYMGYVREIAEKSLDWANLGPIVAANRAVIEGALEADTRKLSSIAAFRSMTADEAAAANTGGAGRREPMSLRTFAEKRRAYLLSYVPKEAAAAQTSKELEQR